MEDLSEAEKLKSYFKGEDWSPAEDGNCHHHYQHWNYGLHLRLGPVLPTKSNMLAEDHFIFSSMLPSSDAGLVASSGECPGRATGVIDPRLKCL